MVSELNFNLGIKLFLPNKEDSHTHSTDPQQFLCLASSLDPTASHSSHKTTITASSLGDVV